MGQERGSRDVRGCRCERGRTCSEAERKQSKRIKHRRSFSREKKTPWRSRGGGKQPVDGGGVEKGCCDETAPVWGHKRTPLNTSMLSSVPCSLRHCVGDISV